MRRRHRGQENIKCTICGYSNHKEYVSYVGICHGCGEVLDGRAYFRYKMNRKLHIWRDDRPDEWTKGNNSIYFEKIARAKNKSRVPGQSEEEKKVCK